MPLPHRKYYQHWDKSTPSDVIRAYCCPCCDYPTVGEPPSFGICAICSWEDDDCEWGANGDYDLEEARKNFKQYLTKYRANEECDPRLKQHGYKFTHDYVLRPDKLEHKKRLMHLLDEYMAEPDLYRRGEIWEKIRQHLSTEP
jgi:hypothetical protein